MKVEIITIGDELLIGQTIDTNSAWMAEQLNAIGISVFQITSISDNKKHIINALNSALDRVNLVLITGGLGPTKDDITKQTLCEYFNTRLIFHQQTYDDIAKFIKKRNSILNEQNKKQAEVPEACQPIRNAHGTAPGMWFEKDGKPVISMPGVPHEMKAIMLDYVIPKLKSTFSLKTILHKTVLVQGIPEALLAEKLESWENDFPKDIKLAYLPSPGLIKLRFSSYAVDKRGQVENEIKVLIGKLKEIIPENFVGEDYQKSEELIAKLLLDKSLTISTAESCTGGKIAQMITSVSGASQYYIGSVIAYHNRIKQDVLNVNIDNINKYGAVSEAVVREMAIGVKNHYNTDFAIATSGIAGPSGGTDEKPVGTTWICIAGPKRIIALKFAFAGSREIIIEKAARKAFNMLQKEIFNL